MTDDERLEIARKIKEVLDQGRYQHHASPEGMDCQVCSAYATAIAIVMTHK